MHRTFLRSKIHRATITSADRDYEGSISIDRVLCKAAGLLEFEQVDVLDITNGARFTTYVIYGKPGQIQINGAAAHLAHPGDLVIIAAFAHLRADEISGHRTIIVKTDEKNQIVSRKESPVTSP
ncbi:MAG: aspartate 1-decarboxylase [Opitutaceae bacterium]|jgi:aspartate 1-decarboxylase